MDEGIAFAGAGPCGVVLDPCDGVEEQAAFRGFEELVHLYVRELDGVGG